MTTYNICGKKVTVSDRVEKIYLNCFPEMPPDFVIRGYLRAWEGPDLVKGTTGTPIEQIVAKHTEKELSKMLDESILSTLRDIYNQRK